MTQVHCIRLKGRDRKNTFDLSFDVLRDIATEID
jgi:hypothetical protein